jgi:hypothetical protein
MANVLPPVGIDTSCKFNAGVVDTGLNNTPPMLLTMVMQFKWRISSRMFYKIRKGANGIIRRRLEDTTGEKPEVKHRMTLSL